MKPGTIRQTQLLNPAEWEGRSPDGQYIYAASQDGCTTISLGTTPEEARAGLNAHQILLAQSIGPDDIISLVKENWNWQLQRQGHRSLSFRRAS